MPLSLSLSLPAIIVITDQWGNVISLLGHTNATYTTRCKTDCHLLICVRLNTLLTSHVSKLNSPDVQSMHNDLIRSEALFILNDDRFSE